MPDKPSIPPLNIPIGTTASAATVVDQTNVASAVKSGGLDVFSTPMMIALMEQAACAALEGSLPELYSSVGTAVSVRHLAASAIGAQITATATVTAVSGRMVEFRVSAHDGTREIGNGTHTRAVIDPNKFMRNAGA